MTYKTCVIHCKNLWRFFSGFFSAGRIQKNPSWTSWGWWSAATQTIQLLNRVMTHDMTCWMVIFFRNRQTNEYIYIFTILIFDEIFYVKSVLTGKLSDGFWKWFWKTTFEMATSQTFGNFLVLVRDHVSQICPTYPRSVRSVYEGSPSVFFCLGGRCSRFS